MALQKQSVPINFAKGLDTKTDDKQVAIGRFLSLQNSVFDKEGLLQKRNGYGGLTSLPDTASTFLTTFNGNLTAIGTNLQAYSQSNMTWIDKGAIQPVELDTLPLIRSNTNQSQTDVAIAYNGLVCTVFTDNLPNGSSTTPSYKYVITNEDTGQNIVPPQIITSTGVVTNAPRVFMLGNYFIIVFGAVISATNHLQYIAISITQPTRVTAAVSLSTTFTPSTTLAFDGVVANNNLYLAWNGSDLGGAVRMTYLTSTLGQSNTVVFTGHAATLMSVAADISGNTPTIYASFYDSGTQNGYTLAVTQTLLTLLAPTATITAKVVHNVVSSASNGSVNVYIELDNNYSYDSSVPTHFIDTFSVTMVGVVSSETTIVRSVGLASKAFAVNGIDYFLAVYFSSFQPTYFLINQSGQVVSKLAYQNGGGYYVTGLPSVTVSDDTAKVPYLFKDLIEAANKDLNPTTVGGVYSQLGINLATFKLMTSRVDSSEIGLNLNISGGFLWAYDGYQAVEQGFHLYPDSVEATTSGTGGLIAAQQYFYQATYEWSDNQGNVFRSAPSIPITITTTGATSSNTINVPTLRLTYKTANPVKISIYRWSVTQQVFYQVTSISSPLLNSTTTDSVAFIDTLADSSIIDNNVLYTTGGVLENIAAPATKIMTLFNNRLFLVDAEDQNLLWFSKQVIEATPVEMSDLLTIFVAPTTSAHGSTGVITAASALDDKLILFKRNAIYYINGQGPNNLGADSQYTDAIFVTATIGCSNQHSIVFIPQGLLFESDKGIWLLGRDLSTTYIGAPVEKFTQNASVLSTVSVPGTNQVRFTLDSGITLMYDYFYGQWGTFNNIPAISSTLYQNLHTYINSFGQVFQETPGRYLDGSAPVVLQFTTGWLNLSGLQGFERAYFFYLLGTYISPHKLSVQIAYDYNSSPTQITTITPDNFTLPWGDDQLWGSNEFWGGKSNVEQWRVFLQQQKCQAFQITVQEIYDPSFSSAPAGAGLTLSGINLVVGQKSSYPRLKASRQVG